MPARLPAALLLRCACALPGALLPGGLAPGLAVQEWEHANPAPTSPWAAPWAASWPQPGGGTADGGAPRYRVGTFTAPATPDGPPPTGLPAPPEPPPGLAPDSPPAIAHHAAPPALTVLERGLPATIPEPATAAVLGTALLVVGLIGRAGLRRRFGLSLRLRKPGDRAP